MIRQLAASFRTAPDHALMPDPWVAKPLAILDRMVCEGSVDLEVLATDVLLANGRILELLDPGQVEDIEEAVFGDSLEDQSVGPEVYTSADAAQLADRVRRRLGTGFHVGVLRSGHPDWQAWLKAHPSDAQQIVMDAGFRAAAQAAMSAPTRRGFRQSRRRTRAEIQRDIQGGDVRLTPEEAKRLMESQESDALTRKIGVATVLMRGGWRGLVDEETGDELPDMVESRLELVGLRQMGDNGEARYEEHPHRDAAGNAVLVGSDQIYGPAPLGDAIAVWLIAASDELQQGHADWLEEQADPLADTPPGTVDTSAA